MAGQALFKPTLAVLFLLLAAQTPGTAGHKWAHDILYGDTANLTCADHDLQPSAHPDAKFQWMLPTGEIVDANTPMTDGHYSFHGNGSTLLVHDVDTLDFGLYYCLVSLPPYISVHTAVKAGINVDGAYYGDLQEKYQPRLEVGLYAGLIVFVIMSMLCFNLDQTQNRLDRPPPKFVARSNSGDMIQPWNDRMQKEMSHENPAFVEEEEKVVHVHEVKEGTADGMEVNENEKPNKTSF